MKKLATVQIALQKACTYTKKPTIPQKIAQQFEGCTHCEIRAYHQHMPRKKINGKVKRTRRVKGFVFIFLILESGDVIQDPIHIMHKDNKTRRDFTFYVKRLINNTDQILLHALNKTTN